tara:strand:+ start:376 stop:978 length:603 start_codon:yes stop_codon:yes gene_type:complete
MSRPNLRIEKKAAPKKAAPKKPAPKKPKLTIEKKKKEPKLTDAEAKAAKRKAIQAQKDAEHKETMRKMAAEIKKHEASIRESDKEMERLDKFRLAEKRIQKERRVKKFLDAPRKAKEDAIFAARLAKGAQKAKDKEKLADAEWNKKNPTRRERTGLSQKSLLRIDRKARMKAKEEAARRKNKGLPQLKHPGPLKPGEAEA